MKLCDALHSITSALFKPLVHAEAVKDYLIILSSQQCAITSTRVRRTQSFFAPLLLPIVYWQKGDLVNAQRRCALFHFDFDLTVYICDAALQDQVDQYKQTPHEAA